MADGEGPAAGIGNEMDTTPASVAEPATSAEAELTNATPAVELMEEPQVPPATNTEEEGTRQPVDATMQLSDSQPIELQASEAPESVGANSAPEPAASATEPEAGLLQDDATSSIAPPSASVVPDQNPSVADAEPQQMEPAQSQQQPPPEHGATAHAEASAEPMSDSASTAQVQAGDAAVAESANAEAAAGDAAEPSADSADPTREGGAKREGLQQDQAKPDSTADAAADTTADTAPNTAPGAAASTADRAAEGAAETADPPLVAEPEDDDDAAEDDAEEGEGELVMAEYADNAPMRADANRQDITAVPTAGRAEAPQPRKPSDFRANAQKQPFEVEQHPQQPHPHHPHHPHQQHPNQAHPQMMKPHPQQHKQQPMMMGGPNHPQGVQMPSPYPMHFPPGAMMTDPFGSMYGYPQPVQFGLSGFPSELADRMRNMGAVHPMGQMGAYPSYTMSPHFVNTSMAPQHVQMIPGAQIMPDQLAKGPPPHNVVMPNVPNQHGGVNGAHPLPHKSRSSTAGQLSRQTHLSGRKSRKTANMDDSRSSKASGKNSTAKARAPVSGDFVRYRSAVQSIFYSHREDERMKQPYSWKLDSLPPNHFRRHNEVKYKPKPKPDFVAYWNESGAKHRCKPELMFRHKKMAARLEDAVKDLKNFNSILKETQKKLAAQREETASSKSENALIGECDKLLKMCVNSSSSGLKQLETSRKSFDSLVESHSKEVVKMAQKRLNGKSKRKRESD